MLEIKVMSKKHTSLGVERQSDLPEGLYILTNNENTFSEINKNFPEGLSPTLRHHHAQNQGYVKKTD